MAKKQAEKEQNNRISAEFERLKAYFEDLDENKKAVLLPLIQNAAFMKITLEDLQALVQQDGLIDQYQNGASQNGLKQSAALQSYNALIKNYAGVLKTIFGYLPAKKRPLDPFKWQPREKTEAEIAEDFRRDAERQARINAEIEAAAERQRRERDGR